MYVIAPPGWESVVWASCEPGEEHAAHCHGERERDVEQRHRRRPGESELIDRR